MATILVTGGAGYVGSCACKMLRAAGHLPVTLDNFSTGWRQAVRFGPLIEADLLDRDALAAAFSAHEFDAVMHFAALSTVGESFDRPGLYWRNNVVGSMNLLDAMAEAGVERLVFSSTCAVYGEARDVLDERHPFAPVNPYGQTKLAIERMIGDYAAAGDLSAVSFRYFNVAGAEPEAEVGEHHRPETHLIPLVLDAAAGARDAVTIFGDDYDTPDGACIRDYLHVSDLCDAHLRGLDRLLGGGCSEVYNLGTGAGYSVKQVIEAAARVTGRPVPHKVGPRRKGDPPRLVSGSTLAEQRLGWRRVRSDLETMIADAWAWRETGGYG